eukprot:augustus_masked-scaffold_3-processed-gene-7.53-mRNA-1 protein AED:1.00 eAED:1.00 QI:0/-1/0/0/-1/1/1/0/1098
MILNDNGDIFLASFFTILCVSKAYLLFSNRDKTKVLKTPKKVTATPALEKIHVTEEPVVKTQESVVYEDKANPEVCEERNKKGSISNEPIFNFLTISNELENSTPPTVKPNAVKVQTIDSEFLSGKVIFALRLQNDQGDVKDRYYPHFFEGRKRVFEIQMQFTLKKKPRGVIYVGGEVPDQMKLGLVSKSLCKAIMAIINRLSEYAHASLATKTQHKLKQDKEQPHIVFPLFAAATKLVVNKKGEGEIPNLDDLKEVPETPEQKKQRRKQGLNLPDELNVGDTVTFSLNSMYLDFVQWKVVNLGALKPMDLRQFWQQMPLSVVVYDLPQHEEVSRGQDFSLHINRLKRYYLNFKMTNNSYDREPNQPLFHVSGVEEKHSEKKPDVEYTTDSASDDEVPVPKRILKVLKNTSLSKPHKQYISPCTERCIGVFAGTGSNGIEPSFILLKKIEGKSRTLHIPFNKADEILPQVSPLFAEYVTKGELSFCKKLISFRSTSKKMYKIERIRQKIDFVLANLSCIAAYQESVTEETHTPNFDMFSEEYTKRMLQPLFMDKSFHAEQFFMDLLSRHYIPVSEDTEFKNIFSFPVLVAHNDTFFFAQDLVHVTVESIGSSEDVFLLIPFGSRRPETIFLKSECQEIDEAIDIPRNAPRILLGSLSSVVQISTAAKIYHIGFESKEFQKKFLLEHRVVKLGLKRTSSMLNLKQPKLTKRSSFPFLRRQSSKNVLQQEGISRAEQLVGDLKIALDFDFSGSFTSIDSKHSSFGRRILNPRSVSSGLPISSMTLKHFDTDFSKAFSSYALGAKQKSFVSSKDLADVLNLMNLHDNDFFGTNARSQDLLAFSADLLVQAKKAFNQKGNFDSEFENSFFKSCGMLQNISLLKIYQLDPTKRNAFFLNVYHTLMLHCHLLFQPPSSILGWSNFGLNSYLIGGTVLSLFDLEHQILKRPFHKIKIGPKSLRFLQISINVGSHANVAAKLLAPDVADFRILFAINCGTMSCPENIFVFQGKKEDIEKQLDTATKVFFEHGLVLKESSKEIRLPKICQWHLKDIDEDGHLSRVLNRVDKYLSRETKLKIQQIQKGSKSPRIKVRKFNWKPRTQFC